MRFILAGSLLAGLNGRSVDLIARNGDARSRAGRPPSSNLAMVDAGAHRRMWRCELEVGGHRRRPGAIVGNGDAAARRARPGRLGIVGCGDARARRKNRLGVSEAASLHAVQGGRNRAGDQGGKPRGLMCSSATLAGFFDLSDASGPPWALLDLLLLFLDVLLLLVLLLVARHCCKVSDEAAFCLIQRPYISKTLLTRRISPRGSP